MIYHHDIAMLCWNYYFFYNLFFLSLIAKAKSECMYVYMVTVSKNYYHTQLEWCTSDRIIRQNKPAHSLPSITQHVYHNLCMTQVAIVLRMCYCNIFKYN